MSYSRSSSERTLLEFGSHDLLQHYPNLPVWAIYAFQSLQQPQRLWTPEARALLSMAHVPPVCILMEKLPLHVGTLSEDLKDSFATEEEWLSAKTEMDLWRLSRDLIGAKDDGWQQSKKNKLESDNS